MKKSFDYFKTLKELSSNVSKAFYASVTGADTDNFKIIFAGTKSELKDNLADDFITPIERSDIFILVNCLSVQMNCINAIEAFVPLFWYDCRKTTGLLRDCFNRQEKLFEQFCNFKDYKKISVICNDCQTLCININLYIMRKIKDCICEKEQQPLLHYAVYAAFLEVAKTMQKTFSEIERIILNNS